MMFDVSSSRKKIKMKVIKILATGTYKRFMWFEIDGVVYCVRINDEIYHALKSIGVPTSQSLRKKHDSKM